MLYRFLCNIYASCVERLSHQLVSFRKGDTAPEKLPFTLFENTLNGTVYRSVLSLKNNQLLIREIIVTAHGVLTKILFQHNTPLFLIFDYFFNEMATLADELAADLDFSSDEEQQQQDSDIDEEQEALDEMNKRDLDGDESMNDVNDAEEPTKENPKSIKKVAKLLNSKQTQQVLQVCMHCDCVVEFY